MRMLSAMILYSFLFFWWLGRSLALALPIHLERGGKSTLSAKYEQANPPVASTMMKTRKLVDMSVSSIRLTSHGAGSNSMYADIPTAVTMVITKGTIDVLVKCILVFKLQDRLTVLCHGLPEWRTDTENDGGKDVLEARD
jgi:hypothetical protein